MTERTPGVSGPARDGAPVGTRAMPADGSSDDIVDGRLDAPTRALVRLAAVIATHGDAPVRDHLEDAVSLIPGVWVEELILQSYLFAGFPRTLNAAREWRRISGRPAPAEDEGADIGRIAEWSARGERTCAEVYGRFYERLRHNIRSLHPALDSWMIVDGYGKVLGREGLDLVRRELCVVAVCAAAEQARQLHSHLHGALHVGATRTQITATLAALDGLASPHAREQAMRLWKKVAAE